MVLHSEVLTEGDPSLNIAAIGGPLNKSSFKLGMCKSPITTAKNHFPWTKYDGLGFRLQGSSAEWGICAY